jgi:transposase-like protein
MQRVLLELEQIHPRARSFAEGLLDGDTQAEIARQWNVTPSYLSKWFRQHRGELAEVLHRHMRAARATYTYDRRTTATSREHELERPPMLVRTLE